VLPSDAVAAKKYGDDTDNPLVSGKTYEVVSLGSSNGATGTNDVDLIITDSDHTGAMAVGDQFTMSANETGLTQNMTFKLVGATNELTQHIEAVQAKINTARVQAGSQYAALESAVSYTTDLTAQYELGYNTVNDVNFSMETAHLAKNQILQQAATAMLAQANQGQQGLLQLIQG
jgi:flagellin